MDTSMDSLGDDMEAPTITLTDFLLARIEEDKQRATAAGHGCGYVFHEHNAGWVEIDLPTEHNARPVYEIRQIEAWSPDRVLAECDAKRRIVEAVSPYSCKPDVVPTASREDMVLWLLAQPYADHPDFNPEWRA